MEQQRPVVTPCVSQRSGTRIESARSSARVCRLLCLRRAFSNLLTCPRLLPRWRHGGFSHLPLRFPSRSACQERKCFSVDSGSSA